MTDELAVPEAGGEARVLQVNVRDQSAVVFQGPRASLQQAAFLDRAWLSALADKSSVPLATALAMSERSQLAGTAFIWHTAFCCSTLLARVLDNERQKVLALKEPQILADLAFAKRAQASLGLPPQWINHTGMALLRHTLRKTKATDRVVVKVANPAINLLIEIMSQDFNSPALFLYSSLRSFLGSVCTKGGDGRAWARMMFVNLALDGQTEWKRPASELMRLTDLQCAAAVWNMEIRAMRKWMQVAGSARVRSLNADTFLSDPRGVLIALDDFFGLGLGADHANAVCGGSILRSHSKDGRAFTREDRSAQIVDLPRPLTQEIDTVVGWVERIYPDIDPSHPFDASLVVSDGVQ